MAATVSPHPRDQPPTPEGSSRRERSHNYLHRRLHASTIGRHHQHRHRAREAAAVSEENPQTPFGFEHVLRRDHKNADHVQRDSSSQQQRHSEERRARPPLETDEELRVRVNRLKSENVRREEELRQRLKSVEEVGMGAIRQLDDTYYAILDKGALLRNTVLQLKALVEASRKSYCIFVEETSSLQHETQEILDSYDGFDNQEKTINTLMAKLRASRDETSRLNDRLETARSRVQVYEERQSAAENSRRKQWRATLGTLLGILVIVGAAWYLRHHEEVAVQLDGVGKMLVKLGDSVEGAASLAEENIRLRPSSTAEDPHLKRLFDDL